MNPTEPSGPNRQWLSEADERAIDALLDEVQQFTPAPPDLTALILGELAGHNQQPSPSLPQPAAIVFAESSARSGAPLARKPRRSLLMPMAGLLALAASLMLLYVRWNEKAIRGQTVAINHTAAPDVADGQSQAGPVTRPSKTTNAETSQQSPRVAKKATPRQGVPLVRTEPIPDGENKTTLRSLPEVAVAPPRPAPREDTMVLVRFDAALADYWDRLGVTPANPLDDAALKQRIKQRFGTSPEFDNEAEILAFAGRLVERFMRDVPLAAGARETMVQQAAQAIQKGEPFDLLISRWVADESLFNANKPELLSQGLATNLLSVDAACARCHDSPVDGRFAQHDYWSFAAVFSRKGRSPLFYELLDGRQQVATARVPEHWLGTPLVDNGADKDLRDRFSQSLIGNSMLAGALANRLWEIGFDAPLVSRASDPVAPPRDDALQASHKLMTNAILASHFDIRAAARLVMSSEAMKRGTSDLYATGRWRMASEEVIAKEALARRTFAAAAPTQARIGRDDLIAMMESRISQTPRALENTAPVLAQPNVAGSTEGGDAQRQIPKAEEYFWAEWIADRELLRESWLHWIKSPEQQQRHALYAAGERSAAGADELATRLVKAPAVDGSTADDVSDRLFWVLRKSR